jgi:hypothetical protein
MTGFIVSVFPFRNRVSSKEAFEGLELGEGKLSRPVLRGPGGRKAAWLLGSNGVIRVCLSGSASFLGTKTSRELGASFSRVAGEDLDGIVGEPIFAAARRATSLAGMRNLRLLGRGRGGHLVSRRFLDD